jgi:alanine racemase
MAPGYRRNRAEVDLAALVGNLARVRAGLAPGAGVLAMVKADAYGHGAVPVSRALVDAGVAMLGVALVEEGVALREAGLDKIGILVLGGALGDGDGLDALLHHDLTPALERPDQIEAWAYAAARAGRDARHPAPFHLKIDTGMARLGVRWDTLAGDVDAIATAMRAGPVVMRGAMSHFASADLGLTGETRRQQARFAEALAVLRRAGFTPEVLHLANSAAALALPETHHALVRPGIALYGYPPAPGARVPPLDPVLRWHTEVVSVRHVPAGTGISYGHHFVTKRPSDVATLAVGYADGYPRRLGGRAHVLVRGHRCAVVGVVCMDLCMVDVTDVPGSVAPGETAVLIGRDGDEAIWADELAAHLDTIVYEVLCGISARVPRVYG